MDPPMLPDHQIFLLKTSKYLELFSIHERPQHHHLIEIDSPEKVNTSLSAFPLSTTECEQIDFSAF